MSVDRADRKPDAYVALRALGLFDPDELSRRIGRCPAVVARAGEPVVLDACGLARATKRVHREDAWLVRGDCSSGWDIAPALRSFFAAFDVPPETMRAVARELGFRWRLTVCVLAYGRPPAVVLDPPLLERLSASGVELHVDVVFSD